MRASAVARPAGALGPPLPSLPARAAPVPARKRVHSSITAAPTAVAATAGALSEGAVVAAFAGATLYSAGVVVLVR